MGVFSRHPVNPPDDPAREPSLRGRRIVLRPLAVRDFDQWREVRVRNHDWLTKWEPQRPPGAPDVLESRQAFAARCRARDRERQLGTGYGFGVFVRPGGGETGEAETFAGEI